MYTPPSLEGTIVQPGIHGGNEWGGPAFDPETNIAYVNVNDFPFILTLDLIPPDQVAGVTDQGRTIYMADCAFCHGAEREGGVAVALDNSSLSSEELRDVISNGVNAMPAFPSYGEEELDRIVAYLESEPGETTSTSDIDLSNEGLTWSGGEGELQWSTSTPQYIPQLGLFH